MGWRPLGHAHLVRGDLNRPFLIDGSGALWAEQNDDLEQTLTQFSPPSPGFCGTTQEREWEALDRWTVWASASRGWRHRRAYLEHWRATIVRQPRVTACWWWPTVGAAIDQRHERQCATSLCVSNKVGERACCVTGSFIHGNTLEFPMMWHRLFLDAHTWLSRFGCEP
jgi:hypothetical protein